MPNQIHDLLSHEFAVNHPEEAARALRSLTPEDVAAFLETVVPASAASVVANYSPEFTALCLDAMAPVGAASLIDALPTAVAVGALRRLDDTKRETLLNRVPDASARPLRTALHVPEGLVGTLMDSRVATLRQGLTVGEAVQQIRALSDQLSRYVYVIDSADRLVGVVDTRDLFLADAVASIDRLMGRQVISLPLRATVDAVHRHPGWARFHVLPVTDRRGVFQGVLRRRSLSGLDGARLAPDMRAAGGGLGDTVLSMAEALWGAGAEILSSSRQGSNRRE